MPTINQLPSIDEVSGGNQIPTYYAGGGDARKKSVNLLQEYMQDNLNFPDNASEVTYNPAGTGAVARTVESKLRDVVSVKDFGAVGNGVADDTAAIQAAIAAVKAATMSGNSGIYGVAGVFSGSAPVLYFPAGVYKITDYLTADTVSSTNYQSFKGDNAIIVPSAGVTVFGGIGFNADFEGLTIRGGANAISIKTANADTALININRCEFQDQTGACIRTDNNSASTQINVSQSKFYMQEAAGGHIGYFESGDKVTFADSWISCKSAVAFYVDCHLVLDNVLGVPGGALSTTGGRWIDFYDGSIRAVKTRFGGESGGAPIIYNYVNDLETVAVYPFIGREIIIDSCVVYADASRADEGIIVSKDGLPALISITNCQGPVDAPLVNDQQTSSTLLAKLQAYTAASASNKKLLAWDVNTNQARAFPLSNDATLTLELAQYFPSSGTYNTTITPSTSGTVTLDSFFDSLSYQQRGGWVKVTGRIRVSSVSSPVGTANIALPWPISVGTETAAATAPNVLLSGTVAVNSNVFVALGQAGESVIKIYRGDATTPTSNAAEQLQAATSMFIDFSYRVR